MDYNNLVLEKALRIVYFNVKSALEITKEDMLALKYLEDNLDFLHKVVEILVEEKCNSNWLNRSKEEWKE